MSYQDVITQLRDARLKKGLTQSDVAREIGVTQSMFSRYEQGVEVPSTTLLRWGEVLGLRVSLSAQVAA